jgi:hypothetical protein
LHHAAGQTDFEFPFIAIMKMEKEEKQFLEEFLPYQGRGEHLQRERESCRMSF